MTCAPGTVWQDAGLIQYRVWHNDIEGKLGLAFSHPLFYLIAIVFKHIPIGDFCYKVNILGTLISAFAIANLYLLLRLWVGENFPALLGAATLALSHTFWQHSTMPETYGLAVALLLLELIMLLQYARTSHTRLHVPAGFYKWSGNFQSHAGFHSFHLLFYSCNCTGYKEAIKNTRHIE